MPPKPKYVKFLINVESSAISSTGTYNILFKFPHCLRFILQFQVFLAYSVQIQFCLLQEKISIYAPFGLFYAFDPLFVFRRERSVDLFLLYMCRDPVVVHLHRRQWSQYWIYQPEKNLGTTLGYLPLIRTGSHVTWTVSKQKLERYQDEF